MRIGIPRALSFYNYYPFWHGFFTNLGFEVVLSGKTTKSIVSAGSALVVTETCLPVKIYVGHVLDLLQNKKVDAIYTPSIQSIDYKIYNCSKIRGLPDLIRNVIKQDFLLIEPTLDKSDKDKTFYDYLEESVKDLGITDKEAIKRASKVGWKAQNNFNMMIHSGVSFEKAMRYAIEGKVVILKEEEEYPINVAVIAHGYNLHDDHSSMKILSKLNKLGVKTYTADRLTQEEMKEGFKNLETDIYWANESEMTGAAGYYMKDDHIDGVITVTAFGCGPDSIMIERMTRFSKKFGKPLLNLTIDEHTGEAGFITRLEAFTDMLFRKKRLNLTQSFDKEFKSKDVNKEQKSNKYKIAINI